MAQFDIYKRTGSGIEYILDLQHDMLDNLSTRVVAPLAPLESIGSPMKILNPQIPVDGKKHVLLTHLLAAIPVSALGNPVGSALPQRDEIIRAVDLLFTGI